ncbi:MAG TPA: aminotransferase class I/II-fold pyridoxal phosphate-dependent enzyme [Blastocatellia bacterium]|nr:aminotransferase class I/II-fold pyridoxal phosphate-dependent enzyme [Blastocatellia bacterium]HMX25354.1 aminotransferase class I/II-fold pyridoxal phosphate-dependent enzyme [Blastocatellia bacterium]HMY73165.1 aminotransferase class I/II-fold pyridoxal phosphate-dependent enzyme [Blastocatellia bacterium]HMZ16653.1 aminotransferase class I/II-fold pyridoxal phosphate-dependent enzyme [Blastocatellia bacterium]HNG32092.1 aminotransferase class I/II-fold pyridoxal phosphate-dependent enzym
MSKEKLHLEGPQTKSVYAAKNLNQTSAISPPIWQTTTFSAESAEDFAEIAVATKPQEFYTRYGNPNHAMVEETLVELEGGELAIVFGSGMGAVFAAIASQLNTGDHIVAQRNHYAGATTLLKDILPRWGIEVSYVDQTNNAEFAEAVRPNTKMIYVESPVNPLMQITDLQFIVELAQAHGILTVCDNTFATPINQRPLELGIDAVIHSATKYIGGHHDATAGAMIGKRDFVERVWKFALVAGAALSPFDAWLLLRGLRTLGLRVERHNHNAMALARFLEAHPKASRVYYPGLESHPQHELAKSQMTGFTGMLSVELRGGYSAADKLMSSLKLATRAASLGGFETLVVHPASMWSLQLSAEQRAATGINEGLVRISVGLEDEADLLRDFEQALAEP